MLAPAAMKLSASDVQSAYVRENSISGGPQWVVMVQLSSAASAKWDLVAQESFHQLLAIDQDGTVVSAPFIQPTQASFSSCDGKKEISGSLTKHEATDLAAAISARE